LLRAVRSTRDASQKGGQELREFRHALSAWRRRLCPRGNKKAQVTARSSGERRCWATIACCAAKPQRRAVKKFLRNRDALKVKTLGSKVKVLSRGARIEGLRLLLNSAWGKWNATIDECAEIAAIDKLHAVRIKAKTLRYSIEPSQKFAPDHQLEMAGEFLKDIQDRVGAWHDELMLGQLVLETFYASGEAPELDAMKLIRDIKEKEIGRAESARGFVLSIPSTEDYRHLRTVLSASIYAMSKPGDAPEQTNITGPLQCTHGPLVQPAISYPVSKNPLICCGTLEEHQPKP
jgi:hypothetical protein